MEALNFSRSLVLSRWLVGVCFSYLPISAHAEVDSTPVASPLQTLTALSRLTEFFRWCLRIASKQPCRPIRFRPRPVLKNGYSRPLFRTPPSVWHVLGSRLANLLKSHALTRMRFHEFVPAVSKVDSFVFFKRRSSNRC